MSEAVVVAICIAPAAGDVMREVQEVRAIAGAGLEGDRYCTGEGSFNKGETGRRQVTLMNAIFFEGSGFAYIDARRNLFTRGVELMWLIGRDFRVGEALLRGIKYCDPCERPGVIAGKGIGFKAAFEDRGGLVAEILESGLIRVGGPLIPPVKAY